MRSCQAPHFENLAGGATPQQKGGGFTLRCLWTQIRPIFSFSNYFDVFKGNSQGILSGSGSKCSKTLLQKQVAEKRKWWKKVHQHLKTLFHCDKVFWVTSWHCCWRPWSTLPKKILPFAWITLRFNPFHVAVPFLYSLNTSENLWLYVFRGCRKGPVTWN